ncbi:TPA: recombinase family protein [Serratia marcescens]|nr:recombinase family protein [Serratia marcescens]
MRLSSNCISLKLLTGHGTAIDTSTAAGKLLFGIFAALEFERELIAEQTSPSPRRAGIEALQVAVCT